MQKIATRVFVFASVCFGVIGIAFMLTAPGASESPSSFNHGLFIALGVAGFVVLASFALSVAGKYLMNDRD
jgi:predicted membrane channel-forming protein YqfA (hemolysin III family)